MKYIAIVVLALSSWACSSGNQNPDKYHIGWHRWQGDTIYVQLYKTSEPSARPSMPKIRYECLSCNLIDPPQRLLFDDSGIAPIFIPEARQLISTRLRIEGSGIDTTFIQKQRTPNQATAFFALSRPLVGRVLVNQLALLYSDTTQDSVVTTAQIGDELNIFGTVRGFYSVHHPRFTQPLLLLKENGVPLY